MSKLDFRQSLEALRSLALMSQVPHAKHKAAQRELAYAWVRTLVNPEASSRSFFLQQHRLCDEVFYRSDANAPANLQPRCRAEWSDEWQRELEFLRHPERLTITELELALTMFRWSAGTSPKFAWWLIETPHVLWRIHAFLLSRYAFYLIRLFEAALMDAGLHLPPFRAGEGLHPLRTPPSWFASPRLIGLTALGYLGLVTVDPFVVFIFGGHSGIVFAAAGVASYTGWRLYYMDVFKQNRGVLASFRHARRRVLCAWGLAVLWSSVLALLVFALWSVLGRLAVGSSNGPFVDFPGESLLANLVVPYVAFSWPADGPRTIDMAVRWAALIAAAIVVGALVQWFWQDESAIEPI